MKILTSELEHSIKGTNMNAIEQLKSVLCDPTGKCCIKGSEEDRAIVDRALEALAQPEQEPVGLIESLKDAQPCCGEYQTCWRACTPRGKFLAQRTWVGLTDEDDIDWEEGGNLKDLVKAIEARLKEKNNV